MRPYGGFNERQTLHVETNAAAFTGTAAARHVRAPSTAGSSSARRSGSVTAARRACVTRRPAAALP